MVLDVQVKRSIFEHPSANEFESVLSWGKLSFRNSFPVYNKETCLFNAFTKLGCPSKYLLTLFHLCFEKKTLNTFHYFLFQVLSPPLWTVVSVTCWVFKHQDYIGIYHIADYSWSPEVPSDPTVLWFCDARRDASARPVKFFKVEFNTWRVLQSQPPHPLAEARKFSAGSKYLYLSWNRICW